jgi:hypothetical protein
MRGVDIQTVTQWECDIIVQRCVGGAVVGLDRCFCQPGDELLNVTNTLGPCEWRSEGHSIPTHVSCRLAQVTIYPPDSPEADVIARHTVSGMLQQERSIHTHSQSPPTLSR